MSGFPPPVPKPGSAGAGVSAIARIRGPFINLRSGPGENYQDIGDIRNNTLLVYYPATRTTTGWVWIEQFQQKGWISTAFVTFEDVAAPRPNPQGATPYDGKIAVWHWKGDVLPENTIEAVVANIRSAAPHVRQLWVKISDATQRDGAQWMGYWDTKRALAIDGPQSIDRWVQVLERNGMEFHAWCVPKGTHVDAETSIIIQACSRPGVRSLILDVEPYAGFWQGGAAGIRPYMTRIRRALPGSFHIGLCVDPRRQHYASIFPQEWFPFVNSVHPMVYWVAFRQTPEEALRNTYEVWGNYGRPIIPALDGDSNPTDMSTAITTATKRHNARGLSWWRLGIISSAEWRAISQPLDGGALPPGETYGAEYLIRPNESGFASGTYTGRQEFQTFTNTWGWQALYKATEPQTSKVWARWVAPIRDSGRYEVSAFIPGRHATTRNARYKVNNVKGSSGELVINVDQTRYSNQWVTLGVFELDRTTNGAGMVFLNDLTGEAGREIAFDALRWRQIITVSPPPNTADGYDSPVGTTTERASTQVWPGQWLDASPFAQLYFIGTPQEAYHTGADLNLPRDADARAPVYATASGVVTFAASLPTWGNVIIIRHDPLPNGTVMYSRSAHVLDMIVRAGDRVRRGQQIAKIGNASGRFAYHLHFDISYTTILEQQPQHWPGRNLANLLAHYVDPRLFILANRPRR